MHYIKIILFSFLCIISFYISDQAILYIESTSPLMKKIKEVSDENYTKPVNAIVENNTIIPGKKGMKINEHKTYLKMNEFGTFNETFLIYDYVKPDISLEDNLDKIIIEGNNKYISLIIDNKEIENYLINKKIKFNKTINSSNEYIEGKIEYINGNTSSSEFKYLNAFLKRKKLINNICLVGVSNNKECKKNKYYLVSDGLSFSKQTLSLNKSKIRGGLIIKISENLSLSEFLVILNEIRFKDLKIVYISELIKE